MGPVATVNGGCPALVTDKDFMTAVRRLLSAAPVTEGERGASVVVANYGQDFPFPITTISPRPQEKINQFFLSDFFPFKVQKSDKTIIRITKQSI